MTLSPQELDALADRLAEFDRRLQRMVDNPHRLSAEGQSIAMGMLVALNLNLFSEAEAAIRTRLIKDQANG